MFDKFIRPADALDRGGDRRVAEQLKHAGTKAVVQDMVFHGDHDLAFLGVSADEFCIEWFDETWIDEGDGVAEGLEFLLGFQGDLIHVAEADDGDIVSVLDDLAFADFQQGGFRFWLGTNAGTTWVTDGGGAVIVVGHGPEHIDEFVLILGLHVDDSGDGAEVGDIEQAVMGRTIITGKATSVHAHSHRKVLQGDIVNDHVDGALHEG